MAILIRKVQSFRKGRKSREYQCEVCKTIRYGVCLIKFMWLKFASQNYLVSPKIRPSQSALVRLLEQELT